MEYKNLEAQFNRACISVDDTFEAFEYLDAIGEKSSRAERQGLIVAAIVSYSRPFLNSKGKEAATPMVSLKLQKELSVEEYDLHRRVINLRSKAVAHSDYDARPVQRWNGVKFGITTSFVPLAQVLDGLDLVAFKDLTYKTSMLCRRKKKELNDLLVQNGS